MQPQPRDLDLALYGATGFVGRQCVEYLTAHAPTNLRWAIAARSRDRLDEIMARAKGASAPVSALVADSSDPASVDALVRRARVVLAAAGPYALLGTPVVDACVRYRSHYVDITGEIAWVRRLVRDYHARAAADGTRIIPCCGFDSVPSDLGAFLIARETESRFGTGCSEVRAAFQLAGGLNGGTVASGLNAAASSTRTERDDPFLLDDPGMPHSPRQTDQSRDLRLPRYDSALGRWIAPFFMAPINTRVVRRSASLFALWGEPYGRDFVYREALKLDPPLGAAKAGVSTIGTGMVQQAMAWPWTRALLLKSLPAPGQGPSERAMNRGWFACHLVGIASDRRILRGLIRHQGDPGNRATTKFVCESALALCAGTEALPGGPGRGGVLTPATGLGNVLAERIRAAGTTIEIEDG